MNYQEILNRVSRDIGLPYEVVKEAYESYWRFIRETIKSLPFKDDLSEEEFNRLSTNFNIPSIGKLNCTYERYIKMKKRYSNYLNIINNADSKKD